MGKFVDFVLAILILIVGLFVLTRLGITWSGIWKMIHTFFSGSSTSNGTASILIFGMTSSNSKIRKKMSNRLESVRRKIIKKILMREEVMAQRRDGFAKE
jgi:hypothetical protein